MYSQLFQQSPRFWLWVPSRISCPEMFVPATFHLLLHHWYFPSLSLMIKQGRTLLSDYAGLPVICVSLIWSNWRIQLIIQAIVTSVQWPGYGIYLELLVGDVSFHCLFRLLCARVLQSQGMFTVVPFICSYGETLARCSKYSIFQSASSLHFTQHWWFLFAIIVTVPSV